MMDAALAASVIADLRKNGTCDEMLARRIAQRLDLKLEIVNMECGEDHRHGFGRWKRPSWTSVVSQTKGGSAANQGGIPCRTPRRKARIIS